jgi:peptidylprolyl isomerase
MRPALALVLVVGLAGCPASPKAAPPPGPASTIANLGSSAVTLPSGLRYEDRVAGTGATPGATQKVIVNYQGWLLDGTVFDSSWKRGEPFHFQLGTHSVIQGWDEGVATMKVGGVRRLVIPPDLAYGPSGSGKIPPNATLVFDVELLGLE